ncbi:MAG: NADH-quinone oxidoreductase subunit A [Planctomycetales bacterium]|nr:NADH-quinone oxidoreductase subunit A [Planctomycetales bacterium]
MSPAIDGSVGLVFYLALFGGVGFVFVFANLLIGRFLRPDNPHEEKQEIYECGEPAIGSSFVQFDLRFYVVALMFIIFDVEVAFLFPWATVFGKANNLEHVAARPNVAVVAKDLEGLQVEMGFSDQAAVSVNRNELAEGARQLRQLAVVEVLVFFVILLIGFAYVWRAGDLDWVRTLTKKDALRAPPVVAGDTHEPVLSA